MKITKLHLVFFFARSRRNSLHLQRNKNKIVSSVLHIAMCDMQNEMHESLIVSTTILIIMREINLLFQSESDISCLLYSVIHFFSAQI